MRYAKIVNGKIIQIETIGNHRGKPLEIEGKKHAGRLIEQHYIDAGWLLEVVPVMNDSQVLTGGIVENGYFFTYEVREKTSHELAELNEQRIKLMREALIDFINSQVWSGASGMIYAKAVSNPPKTKSKAIYDWTTSLWIEFASRRQDILSGVPWDESFYDFSSFGNIPFDSIEAMVE